MDGHAAGDRDRLAHDVARLLRCEEDERRRELDRLLPTTHAWAYYRQREGETPLCDCTDEQAADDSGASYGPRKAEGDRVVFEAASRGINAMSVRPCIVYGPDDYTERLDYWIDRVLNYDRVVVPGAIYRSSRNRPCRPSQVEKFWKYTAKPILAPLYSKIRAVTVACGANSAARISATVAVTAAGSFS